MSSQRSVTLLLDLLKAGDRTAAQPLFERYFHQLVRLAHGRLRASPRRAADEQDVALSAFASFWRGAERGRFPDLNDRHSLWRILLTLTARKAAHLARDERCAKRGGGKVSPEADLPRSDTAGADGALAGVVGAEPTPEVAAQCAEEFQRLLGKLGSDELRTIAVWLMEGDTVEEVAAKLRRAPRTVSRKLAVIRELWYEEVTPS